VGTGTAQIGVHAHVGNVWSAEHTFLRSLCYVHGHVWTNSVETQGFFWEEDSVTDNFAMSVNRTLSWSVAFEPLSPSIEREPWHAPFAALPGQYDKVTLKGGSALQLFSGTYYIRRLSTEPGSTLTLPPVGPIVLYVRDELSLKGTLSSDGSARDVLWVTADAGWVHVESPLFGTLIAPSANVVLAPQMTHRGMVIGKTIALHQRSHFYFEPFSNLRTVFVDMAARCQQCMTTCTQEDQRRLSDYNWRLISDCMDYAGSDSECRTSCYYSHFSDPNSRYQACASACSDYCL
jgi:hypothetical protein